MRVCVCACSHHPSLVSVGRFHFPTGQGLRPQSSGVKGHFGPIAGHHGGLERSREVRGRRLGHWHDKRTADGKRKAHHEREKGRNKELRREWRNPGTCPFTADLISASLHDWPNTLEDKRWQVFRVSLSLWWRTCRASFRTRGSSLLY